MKMVFGQTKEFLQSRRKILCNWDTGQFISKQVKRQTPAEFDEIYSLISEFKIAT